VSGWSQLCVRQQHYIENEANEHQGHEGLEGAHILPPDPCAYWRTWNKNKQEKKKEHQTAAGSSRREL
jgi:hypothetical protein